MGYCEYCEKEFEGVTCPVCGAPLLQEVDPESMPEAAAGWAGWSGREDMLLWPDGPDGQPEEAALLTNCVDFPSFEEVLIARLRAGGIPVVIRYPKAGGLGKVYLGFSGYGADLYVPASRLEAARALLLPANNTGDRPDEEEEP